jgi:hypothetical protein
MTSQPARTTIHFAFGRAALIVETASFAEMAAAPICADVVIYEQLVDRPSFSVAGVAIDDRAPSPPLRRDGAAVPR